MFLAAIGSIEPLKVGLIISSLLSGDLSTERREKMSPVMAFTIRQVHDKTAPEGRDCLKS